MVDPQRALAFVNTRRDRPSGRVELLSDPATATAWLADELGYAHDGPLTDGEYEQLVRLRESAICDLRGFQQSQSVRSRAVEGRRAFRPLITLRRSKGD